MATLNGVSRYLRQKRATGKPITSTDKTAAWEGYFNSQAATSLDRRNMDLNSQRVNILAGDAALRARNYQDLQDENEMRGRVELMKFAVPDLFRNGSDGGGSASSVGAQGQIGSITGNSQPGRSQPAVKSLSETTTNQQAVNPTGGLNPSSGWSVGDSITNIGKAGFKGALFGQAPTAMMMAAGNELYNHVVGPAVSNFAAIAQKAITNMYTSVFGGWTDDKSFGDLDLSAATDNMVNTSMMQSDAQAAENDAQGGEGSGGYGGYDDAGGYDNAGGYGGYEGPVA